MRLLETVLFALCAVAASALLAAACFAQALPVDVSTRVGRSAVFIYQYTPDQYLNKLSNWDVVWNNQPGGNQGSPNVLHFPPATFSGAYVTINRVPAGSRAFGSTVVIKACGIPTGGGCTLAWFQANHPTWIIYKADQLTPAYEFNDLGMIPLDISNAAVQTWIETNLFAPLLSGGYHALSIDNVAAVNGWGEVGVCSIKPITNCTADGGTWTQLYTGVSVDATFAANRLAWAQEITRYAHTLGKSTIGNVSYIPSQAAASTSLINAFDVWFDEDGWTGDNNPSLCHPNNPSGHVGANWIDKLAFVTGLNGGAGPKAHISENSICPVGAFWQPSRVVNSKLVVGNSNFEVVEYAVASYLMSKGAHSYMAWYFDKGGDYTTSTTCNAAFYCEDIATVLWPQFYLAHGAASGPYAVTGSVYNRRFASVLALVNPSTTLARTYDLGARVYHRSDCARYTGVITLPPMTGMVLLNGEPSRCVP